MANHPNRGRSTSLFTVVRATGYDVATHETTHKTVSRHKTLSAARRAIDALAKAEQMEQWPHRIEMRRVIADEYSIKS